MTMMWPLPTEGQELDRSTHWAALTGLVEAAVRDGLPAHELERGLWSRLLQLGHDLQANYFALAGDGDCGEALTLTHGRVVHRLPEPHGRPYRSIFGDFRLARVVYGTREGQAIEAAPLEARLGLPEGPFSYLLQDGDQALAVENPYGQVNTVLARSLGLKQSVARLEAMTRTLAGAVAGYEAARPPPAPATGQQIVVLSADGKGVPIRKPADAPTIAAHDHTRGPKPDRKKRAAPRPVAVVFPGFEAEARQRDPDHRQTWVVLMDGQPALWDAAADTLGDTARVEILDLLHATGSLWEAVHLFQPSGTPLATQRMKVLVHALLNGVGTGVIRWLQDLAEQGPLPATSRTRLARIYAYFDRHRDRIHDDQYLIAGYPIASGVIEGACRHGVKDRMERAGMHWRTLSGAQALLNPVHYTHLERQGRRPHLVR